MLPVAKRRRTAKWNKPLHEDDDEAQEYFIREEVEVPTRSGPKTKNVKVPLRARVQDKEPSGPAHRDTTIDWDAPEPMMDEPHWPPIGKVGCYPVR